MLMAKCKTAVTPVLTHGSYCSLAHTPVLMHWSYCSLALSHRCDISDNISDKYHLIFTAPLCGQPVVGLPSAATDPIN